MARTFAGSTSTDRVVFTQTANINNIRPMSIVCRFKATSFDSTLRRLYDKSQGAAAGSGHSLIYATSTAFTFEAALWGTAEGVWSITAPSTGSVKTLIVTYAY